MSAYQVSPLHLSAVVWAWVACNERPVGGGFHELSCPFRIKAMTLNPKDPEDRQRAFDALSSANAASVRHCYGSRHGEVVPVPGPLLPRDRVAAYVDDLMPVRVFKLLDCYDYQACEIPGYEASEVACNVMAIRLETIKRLPGYNDGEWSI